MKVLITSGGTKVPIDDVRDITNMSSGTFGSKIASQFLLGGHHIKFLHAKNSKHPFKIEFDATKTNTDVMLSDLLQLSVFKELTFDRYESEVFRNYSGYSEKLFDSIDVYQPDVVVLAAAVSDYGIVKTPGKIRSEKDQVIRMFQLTKLIGEVKKQYPNVMLVGFKLLSHSTEEELLQAAQKSIKENNCDLVVANDLADIKAGDRSVVLVDRDNVIEVEGNGDTNFLAQSVVERIVDLYNSKG